MITVRFLQYNIVSKKYSFYSNSNRQEVYTCLFLPVNLSGTSFGDFWFPLLIRQVGVIKNAFSGLLGTGSSWRNEPIAFRTRIQDSNRPHIYEGSKYIPDWWVKNVF